MKSETKIAPNEIYALVFGLFLGLCLWKFGNPVILDQKISAPTSAREFLNFAWPPHWAGWIFLPLATAGAILIATGRAGRSAPAFRQPALWLLPLLWLGWQGVSALQTVDAGLTATTLWQFAGCVAGYFLGALLIGAPGATASGARPALRAGPRNRALPLLLIGVLAAFVFCLVRAADQRLFEFPQTHRMLVEGEHTDWTNFPPETLAELKHENVIITTNGVDVANPVVLAKFAKGRVNGTMVYPNALAGVVLLLLPAALTLTFGAKHLRRTIHAAVIALTIFLGGGGLFWSGSKAGWLIALGLGGLYLLRRRWPAKLKLAAVAAVAVVGLGVFAVRFHHYFAAGATSVGARFDYWRAAIQTTAKNPLLGTGPGTFQRPYAQLKSPDAEMARLAHNDYLEQFSDSGIPGGIFYLAWVALALTSIGRKVWNSGGSEFAGGPSALRFALFAGLLGWFLQGFGEFELYIPALAWTAFTLLGCLAAEV